MSQLTNFTYGDQPVRTLLLDGEPAFIANDLCAVLELTNPRQTLSYLDDDEKGVTTNDTPGGAQQMAYVTEAGMYSLVLRSRKPEAKVFKRWITHEVLPTIRKTGSYSATPALNDDQIIAQALQITTARIKELEPKAEAYDVFLSAEGDYAARDAAQILARDHGIKIGQNRLFRWMREHGWIDKGNQPYQHRIDQGVLRIKPGTFRFTRTNGEEQLAPPQVRVTVKGLERLRTEIKDAA